MSSKNKLNKILLINAVLTNNGDVAITLALYHTLVKAGFDVTIATHHLDKIKSQYPSLPLISDVGSGFIFRKLPFLKRPFKPFLFSLKKEFKDADAVIAVPGGFMNSYYDFENLMSFFSSCRSKGKRVGVYANSFGPFNTTHGRILTDSQHAFNVLMARDERSMNELKELGVSPDLFFKSNDAAFLLDEKEGTSIDKKVAISVRAWSKDDRSMKSFEGLIVGLSEFLLEDGYQIEFISTCQGIENYHDDSIIAKKIVSQISSAYLSNISVDSNSYTLDQLRTKLTTYDFVIGTRLHMCLLSLKSNTPAFNISYEFKGKEAYSYLGIGDYSVDYNDEVISSVEKLKLFMANKASLKGQLKAMMSEQKIAAQIGFDKFMEKLES